ncbi:MAG TPA: haloacid dehalogenase-like hydrolase, partial [Stenomitos sp.]
RPGLPDLLTFLAAQNIPFVIVSGGLRGMVEAAIAPLRSQIHAVYGVDLDTQGAQFKVHSPVEGETELVSKVDIMRLHPAQCTIAIGDSVTDLNMAMAADVVFARDRLAEYLGDRGVSFYRWDTFDDIRSILASQVLNA